MSQRLKFNVDIHAPAAKVSEIMLGPDTFKEWTALFNEGSYYEGGWNKGDKIRFVGVGEDGKKHGMVARIEEHIPNELVSIFHYGVVDGDQEVTEGPAAEGWTGFENYYFKERNGITTVTVEVDTKDDFVSYFEESWPKALEKLKEISER